eukprot:gene12689-15506_t
MTMKTTLIATMGLLAAVPQLGLAQAATQPARNESLKQEVRLGYERGLTFLKSKQNAETGQWGDAEPVAFTALAISSTLLDPNRDPKAPLPEHIEKAYGFLLKNVQPDGGIYVKARANYNTSMALMALLLNPKPEYEEVMLRAR